MQAVMNMKSQSTIQRFATVGGGTSVLEHGDDTNTSNKKQEGKGKGSLDTKADRQQVKDGDSSANKGDTPDQVNWTQSKLLGYCRVL